MQVVRLSALRTGRLYPQEGFLVIISVKAESTPRHNATGRIKSLKNSSDSIGNRTRDLPVCSAVLPQPTAPQRTPKKTGNVRINIRVISRFFHETVLAVEKQYLLHIPLCVRVCVCVWMSRSVRVCMRVRACCLTYPVCQARAPYSIVFCAL
jgi:hypothetical protein